MVFFSDFFGGILKKKMYLIKTSIQIICDGTAPVNDSQQLLAVVFLEQLGGLAFTPSHLQPHL